MPDKSVCSSCRIKEWRIPSPLTEYADAWACPGLYKNQKIDNYTLKSEDLIVPERAETPNGCLYKMEQGIAAALRNNDDA